MDKINPGDFFQWQADSRKRSALFILVFALAAVAWFFILYFGANAILKATFPAKKKPLYGFLRAPQTPDASIAVVVGVVGFAIYSFGSAIREIWLIRERGSVYVATAIGGVPLGETETVLGGEAGKKRETILRNVVSEMCLAAGIPEPDIFIMPKENGANAMAAGLSVDDAALIVTKGSLKIFDRDELSGIIGHELSHILNGDMRHNTIMAGWLKGFFSLTDAGWHMMFYLSRALWTVPLGAFLFMVGIAGDLTGKILQSAFNRRRESLADAYSVQFTRDPACLAKALKKIGGLDNGSYIRSKRGTLLEYRHLFFAESIKSLFQTHPPLAERIWALEPKWSGHWHDFDLEPVDFLDEKGQLPYKDLKWL
jgi:Zn-dependent protease with chaperone function